MNKFIPMVSLMSLFLFSCASPPSWKGSPYLYKDTAPSHIGTLDFNKIPLIHDNTVRVDDHVLVKIYSGSAKPLYASRYIFRSSTGKIPGSRKFIPSASGLLISKNGTFRFGRHTYRGKLKIVKKNNRYLYVNAVSMEDYLTSVVSHEMAPSWPKEALKAQVVVARTYYMRYKKSGLYNIDSTTNAQVYKGIRKNDNRVRSAVQSTKGELITYRGKTAEVFFHACSGGFTASSKEVWGNDVPYLKSIRHNFCKSTPSDHWKLSMSKSQLNRIFHRNIVDIQIVSRTPSNRVAYLNLKTSQGNIKISGKHFRRKAGATRIKSTLFGVRKNGSSFVFAGKGYGHGVGMCQWSARIMAQKNQYHYRQIIATFFPGTEIRKASGNGPAFALLK